LQIRLFCPFSLSVLFWVQWPILSPILGLINAINREQVIVLYLIVSPTVYNAFVAISLTASYPFITRPYLMSCKPSDSLGTIPLQCPFADKTAVIGTMPIP